MFVCVCLLFISSGLWKCFLVYVWIITRFIQINFCFAILKCWSFATRHSTPAVLTAWSHQTNNWYVSFNTVRIKFFYCIFSRGCERGNDVRWCHIKRKSTVGRGRGGGGVKPAVDLDSGDHKTKSWHRLLWIRVRKLSCVMFGTYVT